MLGKSVYEYEGFGFKFGMYSSHITEEISGTNISGLIKRMGEEGKSTTALLHYFYGGAVAYKAHKKLDIEITLDLVADWVESLGDDEAARLFQESLGLPKNLKAPMEVTEPNQNLKQG
jgi:hypothetical protein